MAGEAPDPDQVLNPLRHKGTSYRDLRKQEGRSKILVVQQAKDPALPLQQLRVLLWLRCNPWHRNIHILWVRKNKYKQTNKKPVPDNTQ